MFGQPSGGGLFGQAASSGGGLFGGAAASSGGGVFGAAASSGGGLFGQPASSGGGLFGAAASSGGGLFGAAASSGGGVFGAAASSGGGLFGAAASSGGGLFGQPASSGGGLFGGAASSGGGLFGAAASSGGGMFGGAVSSGGGLFGQPALSGGGMFGAAGSSGGGLFGGAASSGGGLFGHSAAASAGALGTAGAVAPGFGGGGAWGQDMQVQMMFMDMARRMEEIYPALQRSAGHGQVAAMPGAPSVMGFVAFSYAHSDNPQALQQGNQFDPVKHVDQAKFAQAVQNNPDPRSCYPVAMFGLPALERRLGDQIKVMEESSKALEELKNGLGSLQGSLQSQSLQKLEECRRRHQKLQRQLLQVVSAMETYAVLNGAARRDQNLEAHLEERFGRLEEAVHAPSSARARLEELWVVLRGLLQRGPPSGGPSELSAGEAQTTLQVTAAQGELLEALQEELALRKRDVVQFESTLARLTTAPLAAPHAM